MTRRCVCYVYLPEDGERFSETRRIIESANIHEFYRSMSLGDLIHNLPELHKKTIRRKEKLSKKNVKAKYAIVFNQTCLQENILPAYTNI